ncbi:glutamate receptor-interacting protein 1 [Nephila pilipes]|uniref:Glutamate receptor-interacting protein 1 n=1 Tax=Nephila pilipes TaxID=299642 RepID=A0A8X6U417_NEPPI|nr:glutamate receptor-interacting protein 1 [Nephila pilipes]
MKLHYDNSKNVSHVELQKDGATSLGLIVKGGTKYGLRPIIKTVKRGSTAYRSHCVSNQDVIVSISGKDTKGMNTRDVKRILKETESLIELKLEYEIQEICFSKFGIYRPERMSLTLKKEFDSYGFVLRKNCLTHAQSSGYPVFSNIKKGGPADRKKILRAGDRLIQIDGQNIEWLSLLEVADILNKKDEATFLVEYNVAIVEDSCIKRGQSTCLEINCPDTDLGVVLDFSGSKISIENIRKGSLAERCGALHVGDEILAINETDASVLTSSKANILLHQFKKDPGKLIFLPNEDESKCNRQETFDWSKEPEASNINKPFPCSTSEDQMVPPSISSLISFDCQMSSDRSNSDKNEPLITEKNQNFYDFQMENICLLREVVQNVTKLQHFMKFLDNSRTYYQTRTSNVAEMKNNPEQNFVEIELGKLKYLKALCTKTKDSVRFTTMHLVKNANISCRHGGSKCYNGNLLNTSYSRSDLEFASDKHPVQELAENLIELHLRKMISESYLKMFTSKLCKIDLNCQECYEACMLAIFKAQEILLIISLDDRSADVLFMTNNLIRDISTMRIPCKECRKRKQSTCQAELETERNNVSSCPSHKKSDIYKRNWDPSKRPSCFQINSAPSKIINVPDEGSAENSIKFQEDKYVHLNTTEQSAFYIQKQIRSPEFNQGSITGSFVSSSYRVPNNSPDPSSILQPASPIENVHDHEESDSRENYNYNVQSKIHEGKELLKVPKQNCKSAEVISVSKEEFQHNIQKYSSIPSHLHKNCPSTSQELPCCANLPENIELKGNQTDNMNMTPNTNQPIFTMSDIANVQNNIERLSDKSNFYSFSYPKQANTSKIFKIQSSMVEVKLKNEGKGYGLVIGFPSPSEVNVPRVPRITAVSAQGAAFKIGTLLKGDRVWAVNGQNIVGLTVSQLDHLIGEVFEADQVSLTIEFDVVERDVKYGTFEICINKTPKIGLVFDEFGANCPLVVKGVVKGSAAHRSGLLFPGDEIINTNCIRQESYDVLGSAYEKTDTFVITVKRDFPQEKQNEEMLPNSNSRLFDEHSSFTPVKKTFSVTRTSIHSEHETNTTVLEQEFTLFRDSISEDFGFLVQQNITTGEVYISDIKPGGTADCSQVIKKNDRILEVNGVSLRNNKDVFVLSLFLQAEDFMKLKTLRELH